MRAASGWLRVKELEREHARMRLGGLSPLQRMEIYEDLYKAALELAPDKMRTPWPEYDDWRKVPHIRNLVETRNALSRKLKDR